jgi:hypothetical protein
LTTTLDCEHARNGLAHRVFDVGSDRRPGRRVEALMSNATKAAGRLLLLAAIGINASCGDDDDTTFTHDGIIECLEDAGLEVGEGGMLSGEPGISVDGGSVLIVVFDSDETADDLTEDPFFSQGETEAREHVFVYFAPGASESTRTEVDSCTPSG